ncbi:aspartyl protease family protein [Patiriisocius marinus]|uniref:aspartyl protease family protein n=1 Tax=Patiriisocius marinus TaxID=1397112 RepID=UPI00232E7517|nr:aspartyl protease family protein [Patiriisocius marinus]
MKLTKLFYSIITVVLLSSCAGSKIDSVLKQGNVLQENFKTTIPFNYVNGWIVLEVEIQNNTYNFILDTGSSNIITKEFAKKINSKVLGAETIKDINHTENSTEYTKINSIKIGNIDFQNTIAGIVDLNKITEIACVKIDGFIGSNLMRKAVWDFDFQNQLITITNDETNLNIPSETFDSKLYIGTAGIPAITVKVNGNKILNNTVDFGNGGVNLLRGDHFKNQKEEHIITEYVRGTEKAFGGFGRRESRVFYHTMINELKIGDHTINRIHTRVKSGAGNNLGLDFFKNYRVILNWNKKRIRMIEVSKAGNDTYNSYGFAPIYEDGGLYVNTIIEKTSAFKLLKQNDKIVSINNTSYANITEAQYCDVFRNGYDNETGVMSIAILRDGEELTFEILKTKLL